MKGVDDVTPSAAEGPVDERPTEGIGTKGKRLDSAERCSVALLLLLYTLQGIPMGLSGSVPFLLSGRISYKQQSLLSLVSLPFSIKLLWAPIVDAVYWNALGRRRSWLLPAQFAAGVVMVWGSDASRIGNWMTSTHTQQGESGRPNVEAITLFFAVLYFLMATQDIAVDGWALTMFKPENRRFASTCNTVGQTAGFFFSYVGLLALSDASFCMRLVPAKWLNFTADGQAIPLVDLGSFLRFWGWIIIVTSAVVLLLFEENCTFRSECEETSAASLLSFQDRIDRQNGLKKRSSSSQSSLNRRSGKSRLHAPALLSPSPVGAPCEDVPFAADEFVDSTFLLANSTTQQIQVLEKDSKQGESAWLPLQRSKLRNRSQPPQSFYREESEELIESEKQEKPQQQQLHAFEVEDKEEGSDEPEGVVESYILLVKLLFLKPVRELILLLLTCRIAFACIDSSTQLKLIELGLPKEDLALFAPIILPLGIVCPMLVGRFLRGRFPMRVFSYGYIFRMFFCLVWAVVISFTKALLCGKSAHDLPASSSFLLYSLILLITSIYDVCSNLMFVSQMAFFANVSDPRIGGTYMTFLNTITNLGAKWPNTLSLLLMDVTAIKDCQSSSSQISGTSESTGSSCIVIVDAYIVQTIACFIFGIIWVVLYWKRIQRLQLVPLSEWHVRLNKENNCKKETISVIAAGQNSCRSS